MNIRLLVKLSGRLLRGTKMNNGKILSVYEYYVMREYGKRSKRLQDIMERALLYFKQGGYGLEDCYKKPSFKKISAYLECECMADELGYYQAYSTILGYNCSFFSWCGLWVTKKPLLNDNLVTIYLRYDTHTKYRLYPIISVDINDIK